MRGGARVNSGPPPDPDALRRDRPSDAAGWTALPAVVRESAPEFPLPDAEPRELEVWSDLWRLPQAAMWRRLGAVFEVAMYARLFVKGEQGTTSAAAEARQWSDRLGLNPAAMLRLRWRVQEDELEERRARSRRADDELDAVIAVVDGR